MASLGLLCGCVGSPGLLGAVESEGASDGGGSDGSSGGESSSSGGMSASSAAEGESSSSGGVPEVCADVGEGMQRRLDDQQYRNTVRDLFGLDYVFPEIDDGSPFPDASSNDFDGVYATAADEVATFVDVGAIAPCSLDATGAAATACVEQFVDDVGRLAFRHTLAGDERDLLLAAAEAGGPSVEGSLRSAIAAMLAHSTFVRPTTTGGPAPEGAPLLELDAWSLATRLAYFVWNSTPDDALLDAAESGALLDAAELAAQTQRMLADPRSRTMAGDLYEYLFDARDLPTLSKHPSMTPPWGEELGNAMLVEQRRFVGDVASLDALLSATHTFANADIAAVYGDDIQGPAPAGAAFERVELNERRVGVLSRLAFLAKNAAGFDIAAPSRRGKMILEAFYCLSIPPPPPGVSPGPFDPPDEQSFREMWEEEHNADPACATCHSLIDAPGWALGEYDPLGRRLDEIDGYPIDTSGTLADPPLAFDDLAGLMAVMLDDERVSACIAQRYFEFAVRRRPDERDACTLDSLAAEFDAAGGSFPALVQAVVDARAFRLARP